MPEAPVAQPESEARPSFIRRAIEKPVEWALDDSRNIVIRGLATVAVVGLAIIKGEEQPPNNINVPN